MSYGRLNSYSIAQALLTIEGVTLGQSKDEAIADGFKIERFRDYDFLVKQFPHDAGFSKKVILQSSISQNTKNAERISSISVSQLFAYDEQGMAACKHAAMTLDKMSRGVVEGSVKEVKAIVGGSALPSHLKTVYATSFQAGELKVDSSCVATMLGDAPYYSQYFSARL